jgi:hypothetical protein
MTPNRSSVTVKKTPTRNTRKYKERVPDKFDHTLELEELQALKDYEEAKMDFSRYNSLEEHMQLLDESGSLRSHLKNNHRLVANL